MTIFTGVSEVIGDEERLSSLQNDLGDEVVLMLLERVEETVTAALSQLKAAVEVGDTNAIGEVAHSLKGATGSLYAIQFAEMAARIDTQHTDLQVVSDALEQFENSAHITLNWWLAKKTEISRDI